MIKAPWPSFMPTCTPYSLYSLPHTEPLQHLLPPRPLVNVLCNTCLHLSSINILQGLAQGATCHSSHPYINKFNTDFDLQNGPYTPDRETGIRENSYLQIDETRLTGM